MINWYLTKVPTQFNEERTVHSANGAGQLNIHMQKDETGTLHHTIHKN